MNGGRQSGMFGDVVSAFVCCRMWDFTAPTFRLPAELPTGQTSSRRYLVFFLFYILLYISLSVYIT